MKDLLLESTIIQGLVTLILVLAVTYISVTGGVVPDILSQALFTVIGFWFGTKSRQMTYTYARKQEQQNGPGI